MLRTLFSGLFLLKIWCTLLITALLFCEWEICLRSAFLREETKGRVSVPSSKAAILPLFFTQNFSTQESSDERKRTKKVETESRIKYCNLNLGTTFVRKLKLIICALCKWRPKDPKRRDKRAKDSQPNSTAGLPVAGQKKYFYSRYTRRKSPLSGPLYRHKKINSPPSQSFPKLSMFWKGCVHPYVVYCVSWKGWSTTIRIHKHVSFGSIPVN